MPPADRAMNELVLSDGEYAYTQDSTKGVINVHTGPTVINVTGQETPVVYNPKSRRFEAVSLDKAAQICPLAPQGSYLVLENPAKELKAPSERSKETATPELLMGQRVNLPGPKTFSLWPRQSAQVIEGHDLRSNQYLLVRVYDEKGAKENWQKAVMKPARTDDGTDGEKGKPGEETKVDLLARMKIPDESPAKKPAAPDLTVGQLLIIQGNEVSFYIPPTGVEVVKDESTGAYVRDALTLERLEYCILVDEDGNKRYERGPAVVFPRPTEAFFEESGDRSFRPIEMNEIQGIHVKVISAYEEGGKIYAEGEELFITGKDTPIYFPRPEHSLISYDDRTKHYATAIPAGEARYVMNRLTGAIETVKGPGMLLPDPRKEVIVRRVLSDRQCDLWYPGNMTAKAYNQTLRARSEAEENERSGVVTANSGSILDRMGLEETIETTRGFTSGRQVIRQRAHAAPASFGGDVLKQKSAYTQPRSITLDTKFAGVPTIDVWTGFAVMVVSKSGQRKVHTGPTSILLDYDESLEVLELSTGKPKTTDKVIPTVYLRVKNNQIGDIVEAETKDHVKVFVKLSLRANFEGDKPEKWFEVENYVKYVSDHVRSILKSAIRKVGIEEFYGQSEDFVRNAILGQKKEGDAARSGLYFDPIALRVLDVEVLSVDLPDPNIRQLLANAQHAAVASAIQLSSARRDLEVVRQSETLDREKARARAETAVVNHQLRLDEVSRKSAQELAVFTATLREEEARIKTVRAEEAVKTAQVTSQRERERASLELRHVYSKKEQDLKIDLLKKETEAVVSRFTAAGKGFTEALITLGNQDVVKQVASALSVQTLLGGNDFAEVTAKVFGSTKLGDLLKNATVKALVDNGSGKGIPIG